MGQSRLPAEVLKSIKLLARRIRLGRESGKLSARGDTVLLRRSAWRTGSGSTSTGSI